MGIGPGGCPNFLTHTIQQPAMVKVQEIPVELQLWPALMTYCLQIGAGPITCTTMDASSEAYLATSEKTGLLDEAQPDERTAQASGQPAGDLAGDHLKLRDPEEHRTDHKRGAIDQQRVTEEQVGGQM